MNEIEQLETAIAALDYIQNEGVMFTSDEVRRLEHLSRWLDEEIETIWRFNRPPSEENL